MRENIGVRIGIKNENILNRLRATLLYIIAITLIIFLSLAISVQAASITTNVSETNINSTVQLNGTGFAANTMYYIIPLLENKSAWWDSYAENWFFNDTKTNNTINVTTNSSGEFSYSMYIPNDWRVSGGKVAFKIGESVASSLLWSAQGTNWAATQPTKNGITGDSDPNGFIYTASNVAVINQGGIEKFYKSNGTKACNYTYGTASNINDVTTNGSIAYGVTSGGNILRINTTNCALQGSTATAAVVAYSVNVAPDNSYIIITYAASTAPRKYNITVDPPTLIAAYAPTAVASIAYDSCISPSGNVTYIAYANGNVTALNSTSGALLWNSDPPETELGNSGYAFPIYGVTCDADRVYLARGSINYPTGIIEQGFVEALWVTNGSRAWINSKTDTTYDGMDVSNIKCDTEYCYAVKATTPTIFAGVRGSAIVQINKTDGNVTWQNWRSWLPTTYNGPYGTGGTHSSAQTLWIDTNTTGYLYPVYTNGWVQKIAKTDVNTSNYDINLWIRGSTNFWNYIADVQKNIWLSNETPYYTFKHWNQQGVPLNTNNGSINGTFFRFSMLNTFNSFTAYEYSVGNVLGNALFIDPTIQVLTTQRAEVQYFNGTYHTSCPNTRYAPGLTGWKYQDRACHYNEIPATLAGFNIGTTINGTFITGIFYSLVKTKFWDNYSITKYFGTDNWAWAEWHNTTNNQTLGFATKFGADQEDVYSDIYGRAVLFYNNAAGNAYYRPQFRADLNRKSDTYIFFMPKTPDPNNTIGEDTMWRRVDIETQKVANPVNITLAEEDSGSYSISGNTYARRINFTAQEPNLFNRSDEPVEIIFNATGGIRSDCQDVIITDETDTPILLWQVDNFTACSQNTNISVWIMMNWTQNEVKNLRLYYNSSAATPVPAGTTDLIVSTAAGACGTNNHEVNINSSNWYYWARPAAAAPANEITRYNFNDTTTNMWTSATHYQVATCYKNSNTTGTGAGAAADTCGTAAAPISRCLAVGSTGKIFAKLNATVAMGAVANRNVSVDTLNVEYYFFANTGRVRIRTQLNKTLPILNTTVSKNWPPYYYFSINTLVPPSGANAWTYYSGLYEQMKRPVATFNSDYTEANLSSGPLPLMFYIKYDGIDNIPQTNGSILRSSDVTNSYWDKGCTAHKEWQYYVYTGGASYGTATAPAYTSEFISCSKDIAASLPEMGEPGYVNVIPEMGWDDTNVNRWYDPALIGKFYMQPNLYRPYNRENRFLSPYAITNPYSALARISSYIIPVCPEKEYGYKGYDDFLTDLPNLLADTSIHIRNNTNNIPCAAQIIKFTDQRGSDGTQIIFAKNLSVIVGETISAGWTYPFNTHANGTYTLQPNGDLDMTFAQKAVTTTGYYGKYYFTYTPNNYVIHTFSTSGNPQTFTVPTTGASHNVRYSFAPEAFYTKKVYDESTLWNKELQNFTYYRNPCWLGQYSNIYGSTETGHPALATLSTPGWNNPMFAAGYTCARNTYNMEIMDVFRPAWSSLYPTAAAAGVMTENMIDGRMNFAGTGTPPEANDTYAIARHNSLYDYKHNDDFNNIFDDASNLNQDEKHPNKQPWTCQISRHTNRSFCVLTSSLSGLIYNSNPGAGLAAAQPWSPYWTSTAELSTFRHYYMPRFFDSSGWQWTYDSLLEVNIYPGLDSDEVMLSNLLYTSDNPDDYSTFFNKQASQAALGLQQTQFLLKDWKNSVFFVFNRDSRTYSPGTIMNITGVAIRNGEYFANKNFSVGLYLNNGTLVIINDSVNSTDEGFFSLSFNITNNVSSGLHYIMLNYNNSEFNDSIPVMITNLIADITNDKAAYEQGQTVYTNPITIRNSLTGELTDPEQLEVRYINPSTTVIECAKYPSTASVPSCDNNLTRSGTGTYSYNISLGSNPLGTYTVKATVTNEGVTADYITNFVVALIDPCQPNGLYSYALNYPMYYNNISDTLIVIGNSTFGSVNNQITFEHMYEFAQATKGTCIIDKPSAGAYSVKSRLAIGNGTQEVYVSSPGETISFSSEAMPQLFINQSAHMTFGSTIHEIPQEGSNIKFESNQTNDILLDVAGGELAFYDCYVGDVGNYWGKFMYRGSCGMLAEENSSVNSSIIIKKTTFDRASRGQFFFTGNVTIDDMKINRVNSSSSDGYGLVAGCGLPVLDNVQIYHQSQNGSGIFVSNNTPSNTTLIIQNSFLGHNAVDVIANEDGRGVTLVNTEWDRTYGFNWTDTWSGITTIKESFEYNPRFENTDALGLVNTSLIMLDVFGNIQFTLMSNSSGEVGGQYVPTWQVEKTELAEDIIDFNPYRLITASYGKVSTTESKSFIGKTVESKQMITNQFVYLLESEAAAITNITYNEPTKVSYGDEYNDTWTIGSEQLANYPIDTCQYYAIFANKTKLVEGENYTLDYTTGEITFLTSVAGYTIYPVYYYDGNITLTNGVSLSDAFTMGEIYAHMQYLFVRNNLSEDLSTIDGINYNFCVNLVLGNESVGGGISDNSKVITFNDGYELSIGPNGGLFDLAGIGGSGNVESIEIAKKDLTPGHTQTIYVSLSNNQGEPSTGQTVKADLFYPNGTILLSSMIFDEYIPGFYKLSFIMPPTDTPTVYGAYSLRITGGFTAVRTFNLVPTVDIEISGPHTASGTYFSWFEAKVWDTGTWIEAEGNIQNNLDEEIVLTESDMYNQNMFVLMPREFSTAYNSWYVSELYSDIPGKVVKIDEFRSDDFSNWTITGNVSNVTQNCESWSNEEHGCAMHLTMNFTEGGSATISRNFSSLNMTYDFYAQELNFAIHVNLPEDITVIDHIATKIGTDENNYYIENKTLRYWKISEGGWQILEPYYDSEYSVAVGNPDPENLTFLEVTIAPVIDYNNTMEIDFANIEYRVYDTLSASALGKRATGNANNLFWMDNLTSRTYTLKPNERRNFYVGLESPIYSFAYQLAAQFPTDVYIQARVSEIYDAQFYWEQLSAWDRLNAYINGNPGQNLFIITSSPTTYERSDTVHMDIMVFDRLGNLLTANMAVNITYPNGTEFNYSEPIEESVGRYHYTIEIPSDAPYGDYDIHVVASLAGYISTNIKTLRVVSSTASSGSAYPTIELVASTPIATVSTASIGALVKSSTGEIIDCDGNLGITIRDLATGTSTNDTMTNFATGMYNYSWTTPMTPGIFYVNTSCSISGTSYTGFTLLSTQPLGATASIDYNMIATYVWNHTSRNLTYYNQSAAESIQSCLKDAECSGWWMNTTLTNIQNTINQINITANSVKNSTELLLTYFNCTQQNDICTRLQNILSNTTDIQARVNSLNATQIPGLQISINNIYNDTQSIRTNMTLLITLQETLQYLNNTLLTISSNISYISQNMLNQSMFNANMTELYYRLDEINVTTQGIALSIDCSSPGNSVLCTYIDAIAADVSNIFSDMATSTQITDLNSNISYVMQNMLNQSLFNSAIINLTNRINEINTTTQNIQNTINCSNPANSVLCGYLNSINQTANNIQTNMATASQVSDVLGNTSWLINNVATSTEIQNNFTQTLNTLNSINSTIQTIYTDLLSTNQTLSAQVLALGINLSWIRDNVATSTEIQNNFTQTLSLLGIINNTVSNAQSYLYGEITNRLTEINTTTNNTQAYMYGEITNRLSELNLTLNQTYSVVNNMSLQQNNSQVLDELNNLQQNLTFIRNNMFYQGNATGTFIVDYVAAPYTEKGNRAELWIATTDLLGNQKTVISADCNISRNGTTIASATTVISPGSVYAYWDIPSVQNSGEYSWNCILNGSIMNINVPFFIASQGTGGTDFEISALVSGSPRYPNEDVLVEVMFSGLNGSSVEPDTINMTIYDTNNNAWANASKSSFTKNAANIWQYSKSIEANPTTGMYTIHVYATYQGITESKSTQFRIATGGPYKVYVDCPSSSYVGQDLGCTVIIQDEGEAATESITTVWVDINNNGVNDTGESRMSFSKRTEPFQTVTQPITLNIPSNHPLGLFMIQAETEYVGSAQPNSKASDTVIFSVSSPSTGTGTGGGAGGGTGGASIPIISQVPQSNVSTNDGSGRNNNLNLSNAQVYLSGEIVCNRPYIRKGAECCLDLNTNAVCDYDERTPSQYPNPEESKGIMRLFTDQQLYLTILVIGLCFLVLLIFLIFLLIPNYVKRMRKALLTEKEMKRDEEETKQYLKEYMNIYKNPDTQIYGSVIQDSESKKGEIHVVQERTPLTTVGSEDKTVEEKRQEEKKYIEIKNEIKEEIREEIKDKERKKEEKEPPKNSHEPYLNVKKNTPDVKEVYGEKRFFMNDGMFISSLVQLVVVLENIDVEAFNRHVNDHKNDFYNWVYDTFQDKQLAAKIKDVRNKKEMADIIKDHLLRE